MRAGERVHSPEEGADDEAADSAERECGPCESTHSDELAEVAEERESTAPERRASGDASEPERLAALGAGVPSVASWCWEPVVAAADRSDTRESNESSGGVCDAD